MKVYLFGKFFKLSLLNHKMYVVNFKTCENFIFTNRVTSYVKKSLTNPKTRHSALIVLFLLLKF